MRESRVFSLQLAIEINDITHLETEQLEKESRRQKELEQLGIKFLRFTSNEVYRDIENVLRAIEHWILNDEDGRTSQT